MKACTTISEVHREVGEIQQTLKGSEDYNSQSLVVGRSSTPWLHLTFADYCLASVQVIE
jgi:hypothetical protein